MQTLKPLKLHKHQTGTTMTKGGLITCGSTGEADSGHILRSGQEQVHWVLTPKPLYEHVTGRYKYEYKNNV